jgi:hypothetical protein
MPRVVSREKNPPVPGYLCQNPSAGLARGVGVEVEAAGIAGTEQLHGCRIEADSSWRRSTETAFS